MARAEAYLHAKFHLDPSSRLATIHQRHRQTDRIGQTDRTGQTDRQRSDSIRRTVLQTVAQSAVKQNSTVYLLWPPCVADADIIFMVALCNRADHYIFALLSLSSIFFIRRLISAAADWMSTILPHIWCGLSANLECRSEMCCTRLASIEDAKMMQKIAICAPSHNIVGLYLRNWGTY